MAFPSTRYAVGCRNSDHGFCSAADTRRCTSLMNLSRAVLIRRSSAAPAHEARDRNDQPHLELIDHIGLIGLVERRCEAVAPGDRANDVAALEPPGQLVGQMAGVVEQRISDGTTVSGGSESGPAHVTVLVPFGDLGGADAVGPARIGVDVERDGHAFLDRRVNRAPDQALFGALGHPGRIYTVARGGQGPAPNR